LENYTQKIQGKIKLKELQIISLLATAHILRAHTHTHTHTQAAPKEAGSFQVFTKTIFSKIIVCICNRMRPSRIKDEFSLFFQSFQKITRDAQRQGQRVKTLKIKVKNLSFILR